jgi:hypothetical protein
MKPREREIEKERIVYNMIYRFNAICLSNKLFSKKGKDKTKIPMEFFWYWRLNSEFLVI